MPRGRKSKLFGLEFQLRCEWTNCDKHFSNLNDLKQHLLDHFQVLREKSTHASCDSFCGICHTVLHLEDVDSVERHLYYHAWSIHLRIKGRHLQELNNWPPCLSDATSRNIVPELPTKFECGWEYCDHRTNDISEFSTHVSRHSEEYTDSRYPAGVELKCLWESCSYVAPRLKNLTSHLVTHTQNKLVACPTCGLLLVSFIKFENHLKRQQVYLINGNPENVQWHPSVQPVQCARCHRLFATERLLVAHMKRHVNTVKCPQCDMTVFGKSGLDRHILFRHSEEKPFACDQCEYRCKTVSALDRHVRLGHKKRKTLNSSGDLSASANLLVNQPDADLDSSPNPHSTGAPVLGPLAAAGALSLLKTSKSTESGPLTALNPIDTRLFPSNPTRSHWIRCTFPGCKFKTTKQIGFQVHIGRKHTVLGEPTSVNGNRTSESNQQSISLVFRSPLYACHLCSVVKRRGFDLSKHLMRDHKLARPSGHIRFTYALEDDGLYRLERTRLDTVSVAAALLGEQVVNRLLSDTDKSVYLTQ